MNWVYHFAEDGLREFRKLDPWLQEAALDRIDEVLDDDPDERLRYFDPDRPDLSWCTVGGRRYAVELSLNPNLGTRVLNVLGVEVSPVRP